MAGRYDRPHGNRTSRNVQFKRLVYENHWPAGVIFLFDCLFILDRLANGLYNRCLFFVSSYLLILHLFIFGGIASSVSFIESNANKISLQSSTYEAKHRGISSSLEHFPVTKQSYKNVFHTAFEVNCCCSPCSQSCLFIKTAIIVKGALSHVLSAHAQYSINNLEILDEFFKMTANIERYLESSE